MRQALGERHLELELEDRERGAQLVAGVGDEDPLAIHRLLQPVQHLVERVPQPVQLVVGARNRQAVAVAGARDPRGTPAHPLDRRQRERGEGVAGHARQHEQDRPADEEHLVERAQRAIALRQRRADDKHRGRRGRERLGDDPRVLAASDEHALVQRAPDLVAGQQRLRPVAGRRVDDPTRRRQDLGEGAAALGQLRARAQRAALAGPHERREVGGAGAQPAVDPGVEAGHEARVQEQREAAEQHDHHPGEREREPHPDRQAADQVSEDRHRCAVDSRRREPSRSPRGRACRGGTRRRPRSRWSGSRRSRPTRARAARSG